MNLSRRSLLTGLLSSAAVIAAGPVAKVIPVDDGFGVGPAMQSLDVAGRYESYTSYFRWVPYNQVDWARALKAINLPCDVLEVGPEGNHPRAAVWTVGWEKAA